MRVLIAVLALLVLASPAQASWQVDRAQKISQIVWHHPCVDRMTFVLVDQAQIDKGTVLEADQHVAARGDATTCVVSYGSSYTPETTPWEDWCSNVLHEAGHLANYRDPTNASDPLHSSNPRSIMFWIRLTTDPRCYERGRPFLKAHGAL